MRGSRLPGIEPAEHLLEVVLGVRGEGIPPRIDPDGGSPRDTVVELDVRRFRLVELHIPVAVRGDFLRESLAEGDLREGGTVRWETSCRERSRTCSFGFFCWLIWCFFFVVFRSRWSKFNTKYCKQTHSHIGQRTEAIVGLAVQSRSNSISSGAKFTRGLVGWLAGVRGREEETVA